MVDLHSSREAGSAQGPPSATERRECKSRVTLLLRDADSGQIDHVAAEPTHGPHHPCTHRIPDPNQKRTIRAAPFRILLWYFESPRRPQLNMLEWFWLMPAPLTLNTYNIQKSKPASSQAKAMANISPSCGFVRPPPKAGIGRLVEEGGRRDPCARGGGVLGERHDEKRLSSA